jgi:carbon-monoxide dehydrogenase large subunit
MEVGIVSVLPDGRVEVRVGTKSQGQAHETSMAQVAADAIGTDVDAVTVRDGDTDALVYGQGTWGSRSAVMAGGAVLAACAELRAKVGAIAAQLGVDVPAEGPLPAGALARIAGVAWWHQLELPAGMAPGLTGRRSTTRATPVPSPVGVPTTTRPTPRPCPPWPLR